RLVGGVWRRADDERRLALLAAGRLAEHRLGELGDRMAAGTARLDRAGRGRRGGGGGRTGRGRGRPDGDGRLTALATDLFPGVGVGHVVTRMAAGAGDLDRHGREAPVNSGDAA